MKITKRIQRLKNQLATRMDAKTRRGLEARVVQLDVLRKAKYGK